jgi:protein-tyrosine phosphatase
MANKIIDKGQPGAFEYTYDGSSEARPPVRHPHDDKVWIGAAPVLHKLPTDVDAVVSLCRIGDEYLPAGVKQLDVRLIDQVGENANLDFVLLDTVRAIEQLRAEGRTVFLHCVAAYSRTPTIAALYGARKRRIHIDQALRDVTAALLEANPNPDFHAALRRLHPTQRGAS